jgi:hypothetical protein
MITPAIELSIVVLEEAIKEAPEIKALVMDYLNKDNPTLEERALLRTRIASATYKNLVPDSKLSVNELTEVD